MGGDATASIPVAAHCRGANIDDAIKPASAHGFSGNPRTMPHHRAGLAVPGALWRLAIYPPSDQMFQHAGGEPLSSSQLTDFRILISQRRRNKTMPRHVAYRIEIIGSRSSMRVILFRTAHPTDTDLTKVA